MSTEAPHTEVARLLLPQHVGREYARCEVVTRFMDAVLAVYPDAVMLAKPTPQDSLRFGVPTPEVAE